MTSATQKNSPWRHNVVFSQNIHGTNWRLARQSKRRQNRYKKYGDNNW